MYFVGFLSTFRINFHYLLIMICIVELISQFNDVKLNKTKVKYVVYKIDGPQIVVDKTSESDSWDEFIAEMPADDCRYALYDMDFKTSDDRAANKLVMISWAPETAKVRSKMVYAGSKDALNRALVGVATKVHATDLSELTKEVVVEACKKFQ